MALTFELYASLGGPDLGAIAKGLVDAGVFPSRPERVKIAGKKSAAGADWIARATGVPSSRVEAGSQFLLVDGGTAVKVFHPGWTWDEGEMLSLLAGLPITEVTIRGVHKRWYEGPDRLQPGPVPVMFGGAHYALGSFCAFKGDGHANLVSRRWLEHGPWRLVRGRGDVSLVQFHDLAADPAEALAQAAPGHRRMADPEVGGYIAKKFPYETRLEGLHSTRDRKLWITVAEREVAPLEMLTACAARRDQKLGAGPFDSVAFSYIDEPVARRQVHELWLRELECWTYVKGVETRIDQDHRPPAPEPPAWARSTR